jgi:Asp-tRNA(Asn)/Glu-tRNA(Gln) amidotransferase A subunit family amidase
MDVNPVMDSQFFSCKNLISELSQKKISSREIFEMCLKRIQENKSLNAVAYIDEDLVRRQADNADQMRMQGVSLPLLGIPISVKDSISVKDMPWRSGSFARADVVGKEDASVVEKLRNAGAIFICKSTIPEYTWSVETDSALHGPTLNPYDVKRTCGGSSGGEAVLHAIQASPAGVGSDGLNSIRVPAHFCGTAGLRPTSGVIPETGVWPTTRASGLLDISTIGPMSRSADDLDLLFSIMRGPDNKDPFTHPMSLQPSNFSVKDLKIGFFQSHPYAPASRDVQGAVVKAAQTLSNAGAKIEEINPWPLDSTIEIAFGLMAPDGGERVRNDVSAAGGKHAPSFAALLNQLKSQTLTITQYLKVVEEFTSLRSLIRTTLSKYDAVIMPVASDTAPLHLSSLSIDGGGLSIEGYSYSFAIALAGAPSVSVPIQFSTENLPIGVQIVGSPHDDYKIMSIATYIQKTLNSYLSVKSTGGSK